MAAPVVTFYEETDTTEYNSGNPFDFGTVDASTTSTEQQLNIWNNKDGETAVSDMENVRITTVTKNGLDSGDGVANGQEVVEDEWLQVESITLSETEYSSIGGATTHDLDDISGDIDGAKHEVNLKAAVPADATAGAAEFKIRVLYQYT